MTRALGMVSGWLIGGLLAVGPAAALAAVAEDLAALPAELRGTARYLWLGNLAEAERPAAESALGLAVNLASRRPRIVRLTEVDSALGLWRLDLARVGWPADLWDLVVREGGEPYFHLTAEVINPANGQRERVITDGGWVDLKVAAEVRALSGSVGAVVRGDWWFSKCCTTRDGGFYYELAGVAGRTADEVYADLGVDVERTDALAAEGWANLWRSNVTLKARRIRWRRGALGSAWKTEDYEANTGDRDPFRNPLGGKYDASEHFLAGPTEGLPRMLLFDGANRLTRTVPDVIAKDHTDAHGDGGVLAPWLSCVACHRQNLLQPFENDQRWLLRGRVDLLVGSPAGAEKAAAFYERDLERQLARDREDWREGIARASGGLTVDQAADVSVWLYRRYAAEMVTPERAAAELGWWGEVDWSALARGSQDPIWLALAEGVSVQRKQFEASFAEGAMRSAAQAMRRGAETGR